MDPFGILNRQKVRPQHSTEFLSAPSFDSVELSSLGERVLVSTAATGIYNSLRFIQRARIDSEDGDVIVHCFASSERGSGLTDPELGRVRDEGNENTKRMDAVARNQRRSYNELNEGWHQHPPKMLDVKEERTCVIHASSRERP